MDTLTAQRRSEWRRLLKARFADVWNDVQQEMARFNPDLYQRSAGEAHDLGDEAQADVITDVSLAEVHRDIGELRDIDAALTRIAEGTYGQCLDCGSSIGSDRLRAYPTAKRCIDCQQRHEVTHVSAIGPKL